ncbi:6-hydroxymethylpterin diphosphokinase MptE-like protein [Nitrospira sp. Kam-Ns4a]
MKAVACLICGHDAAEPLAQYHGDPYHRHLDHLRDVPVTYVICPHCGFVYTNPQLEPAELETLYGEKLRPEAPGPEYLKANRAMSLRRYQWIARELGLPGDARPHPSVLEVGCAAGVALTVFREYGWETCGIEPAVTFAAYARERFGLDVQLGFYGPGAFAGRTFDLILCSQVLEHVPDPDALLAQARVNLKDDGHVFIGVPTLMRPMRPVHPLTLQAIHLWIFSLPTLRLLLERNGLAPVAHSYDAKGLLVLAKKAAPRRGWRAGAGDDAARVRRYFTEFTAPDSLYARNLAALASAPKDLARPPDLDADLSAITVEPEPGGWLNLHERTEGGARRLYDEDPRESARRWVERFDFGVEGVVVLLGLGLGYLALAVLAKLQRGHVLVICEADPRIFRAALFHQDLTTLLNDPRVHLVVGEDIPRLDFVLFRVAKVMFTADRMHTVRCRASAKWDGAYYRRIAERVRERLTVLEINRNTIGHLGRRMLANTIENAHLTARMPGVARFAGLFKGCPAIIVSAGPSLEKNFELLREVKGRAVIIACDTVLRMLVPHGVMPDVTITADPHEATYRKFRDLPMDPDAILVCHPANYPDIFRTFAGRRVTTETGSQMYRFLSRFWAPKGRVDHRSQSSAHQAFNFATLIGADPIIFIGQDLCYYDNKKHAGNLTKGNPIEAGQDPKDRRKATDILGRPVETTTLFLSFKIVLEDLIRDCPARVINATEGGLGLAGTEVLTLRDAIAECCPAEPIRIAARCAAVFTEEPGEVDLPGLAAETRRMLALAKETLTICRKMIAYVAKAARLIRRHREDSPRAVTLSQLAERQSRMMEGRKELMDLLVEGAFLLELFMSREENRAIDELTDPKERFRRQIQRAQRYYRELKAVLEPFIEGLELLQYRLSLLERLQGMRTDTAEQRLEAARLCLELLDYPRAKAYCEQVLEEDPGNLEALFHLGDILYRCHRPHEALSFLRRVMARAPRYRNVDEVIRRCREKAEAWAAKVTEARQVHGPALGDEVPLYEGEFYWKVGDLARAERKLREAIRLAPVRPEPYLDLARLLEERGDPLGALGVLEEALAALPEHPLLLKAVGLFSARLRHGEQAEQFLRAAAARDPSQWEAAGDGLFLAERYLAAGECYEEALRREPARTALALKAAAAYQRAGNSEQLAKSFPLRAASY